MGSFLFLFLCFLKLCVCGGFFVYASFRDVKCREVSNRVWLLLLPFAAGFAGFDVLMGFSLWWIVGSVVLNCVFALALFYLLGLGGADCKFLLVVGVLFACVPFAPLLVFLVASCFACLVTCSVNFVCNLLEYPYRPLFYGYKKSSWFTKGLMLFLCRRVDVSRVDCVRFEPAERFVSFYPEELFKRGLRPFGCGRDRKVVSEALREAAYAGGISGSVWACHMVALIPYLTVSLFLVVGVWAWLFLV